MDGKSKDRMDRQGNGLGGFVFEDNGNPTEGGINDLRMGTTDKRLRCATCKCNMSDCPGHFGFIHLVKPVFHVGFINQCLKLLKCVCYNCSKILIDDYEKYMEIRKISNPKTRQLKIQGNLWQQQTRRRPYGSRLPCHLSLGCCLRKSRFL